MSASSEMRSAMLSLAPWRASSAVSTPFSGSTKAPAASSGAGPSAAWAKSSSARGSSPFSRATVARVRRFCL